MTISHARCVRACRAAIAAGLVVVWAGCAQDAPPSTHDTDAGTGSETDAADAWQVGLEVDVDVGALWSVWGQSVDQLYAVGGQTLADMSSVGAMMRYDGTTWRPVDLPAQAQTLNWIYGVGDARFAVGDGGTILRRAGDDDATPWTVEDCATQLPLWGVWGASADDVWVVGGDGFNRPPVLCRFDGTAWTPQAVPELGERSRAFFKVWGTAADDVWAVGDLGVAIHFDGTGWTEVVTPTEADIISLWGRGPDDLVAVGGRSDGVVLRWDGAQWRATPADSPGLNGVWMDDAGQALVVGAMGTTATVAAGTSIAQLEPSPTILSLHAVFGIEGRAFAVGGNIDGPPPHVGIVLER